MQWLMAMIPVWLTLQILMGAGHLVFTVWNAGAYVSDCPAGVHYLLCGTPVENLMAETEALPDFEELDEDKEASWLSRLTPDFIEGAARGAGGVIAVGLQVPVVIVKVVFFDYEILRDPSFLGLFGIIAQAVSWIIAVAAIIAVFTAITGIYRG